MLSTETSSQFTLSKPNNKSVFYAQHIKDWQQSGLSQDKYCKSVNISYPAFVYWRVKFLGRDKNAYKKQQCLSSKTVQEKKPIFTQIKIKEPVVTKCEAAGLSDSLALIMPNGIKIVLPITIDNQRLISLAQTLWSAIC